jgi:UDP-N-acetylmuramoyl-tripeptide--D-alanyl-D-alanine ligase
LDANNCFYYGILPIKILLNTGFVLLNYLSILLVLIGFLAIRSFFFKKLKYLLHMFQQNGYKLNEYINWLNEHTFTKVVSVRELLYFTLALAVSVWAQPHITDIALAIGFSVYSIFWFVKVDFYDGKAVKKPLVATARMKRLFLVTGILVALQLIAFIYFLFTKTPILISYQNLWVFAGGLAFMMLNLAFVVLIAGFILKPVEHKIQEGFKNQAREKLAALKHLKIVAITGSYGKTSVKFMLQAFLKSRYQVCYTPGSFNTPMGICKVINNDLNAQHQILILEMGARYLGNIEELTQIARPNTSLVTNVGYAHLETFGTQDAIAHTKAAIVRALVAGETAVLNADDVRVREMGKDQAINRLLCGIDDGELRAANIEYGTFGCKFDVLYKDERVAVTTPLLGAHNVSNMLLAFGVGLTFGIRLESMAEIAKTLEPTEHRLELKKLGHYYMIDDAFNSNPVGAKNAVEILAQFKEVNRYIITPGMIELGERSVEENQRFGEHIGNANLEAVFLVGKNRTKPIYEGILSTGYASDQVFVCESLNEANALLRERLQENDVVLYENDLPDSYNE